MTPGEASRILILGGHGFIGRNLQLQLEPRHELHIFDRFKESPKDCLQSFQPDVIINCSASTSKATFHESLEANVLFQARFLDELSRDRNSKPRWIQISSYFELQIPYGRADNYSKHKALCRHLLQSADEDGILSLASVILPHVVGPGEAPDRLFPTLLRELGSGRNIRLSSGSQFIPILAIWDCCDVIELAITCPSGTYSAAPVWYGRLTELVDEFLSEIGDGTVEFNRNLKSVDSDFPKVDFGNRMPNWKAQFNMVQIFDRLGPIYCEN
jgi:nucleoside-diphosphate-sugar epimerase